MWNPGTVVAMSVLVLSAMPVVQNTRGALGWRVELRSSGGITGRGLGGVAVQSDGAVVLIRLAATGGRAHNWEPTCTVRFPDQVRRIADVLEATRPETWRERYASSSKRGSCCDGFQWDLEVIRTAISEPPARHRTSWTSDDPSDLPDDVSRLRAALLDVWNAAKLSCGADGPVDR